MQIQDVLRQVLGGGALSEAQAEAVFERMLGGELDEAQIAALLALIQQRGATVDELVGAARVMRRHVTRVAPCDGGTDSEQTPTVILDTCGTGGAPKTFNVSTAVAIVTAAASPHHIAGSAAFQAAGESSAGTAPSPATPPPLRILVAKHGNRSRSGRGSAEVLAKLGVNVDAPPEVQGRCLAEAGVCFCFAIHHHPATRHAIGPRRSLGFPTMFNLLGPLTNPAGSPRQLIGIYAPELVEKLARVLARLGAERAMVVHGSDGMDELTTTGPSLVAHVEGGQVRMEEIDPAALGVPRAKLADLTARDLDHAAAMILDVLAGQPGAARDIVLLNTAAALVVAGATDDLAQGMELAAGAIDSGRAKETLKALAGVSGGVTK